jgi:hypothetical protein
MPNPSVVQTNTAKSTAASNLAVSLASLPAVGRWVVVTVWSHTFGTVFNPTCADNQGNTYARDAFKQDGSNNGLVAIFSALVNASSGTFTVTVSNATASDLVEVSVSEVANLVAASVVDGSSSAAGTSTSPAPGPVTTANAPDIVFAVSQNADTSSSATYTTPVGFVSIQRDTSGSLDWCGEAAYQVEASAGTYNPTWTTGSFAWSAVQVDLHLRGCRPYSSAAGRHSGRRPAIAVRGDGQPGDDDAYGLDPGHQLTAEHRDCRRGGGCPPHGLLQDSRGQRVFRVAGGLR